jgi:hypothetical protein
MTASKYNAFDLKRRFARYSGVGDAYRVGNAVRRAADEPPGALAVWEGEGGRIAPLPEPLART